AYRPLDVIRMRKGVTVEVTNTDAEGRLVLADALTEADREKPDLLIDLATLTGAARLALGTELTPFFSSQKKLADDFARHARAVRDPVWRLPLHRGYRRHLESKVADLKNAASIQFAGAITAALFLREFVSESASWLHLDLFGWNDHARPGRPIGGRLRPRDSAAACAPFAAPGHAVCSPRPSGPREKTCSRDGSSSPWPRARSRAGRSLTNSSRPPTPSARPPPAEIRGRPTS